MIELRNIGLINWYLLDAADIPIEGCTAIIGENRSGKSTLLDLIQTVMTGSHKVKRLNASAVNENRRRSKRTVRDYCLGFYGGDTTPPLRDSAISYLVLAFLDTDTNEPLSLCIGFESRREDKKEEILGRFIVPGLSLNSSDFISGDNTPKTWTQIEYELEARCDKIGTELLPFTSAKQFVGEYLKSMSKGRVAIPDVEQYFKSFTNAVAFEEIKSVNDFVRDYILPENDIKVEEFRKSIQRYKENSDTINDLLEKLSYLKDLLSTVEKHRKALDDQALFQWVAARSAVRKTLQISRKWRLQKQNNSKILEDCNSEISLLTGRKKELVEKKDRLQDQIKTTDPHGKRALLARDIKEAKQRKKNAFQNIQSFYDAIKAIEIILPAKAETPDNFVKSWGFLKELVEIKFEISFDTSENIDRLIASQNSLDKLKSFFAKEAQEYLKETGQKEKLAQEAKEKLTNLQNHGSAITSNTSKLIMELENKGFRPRLVCQQLKVCDDSWQNALEGLLGRDREAIIVEPEYVNQAVSFYSDNRKSFRGCRIVNTRKLDPSDVDANDGTLASVVQSEDGFALAFIKRRIGNVRLADNMEELHRPGRAITRDCIYDDGLTIETKDPRDWKIGIQSSAKSEASLTAEVGGLNAQIKELEATSTKFTSHANALEKLIQKLNGETLTSAVEKYFEAEEDVVEYEGALEVEEEIINPELLNQFKQAEVQLGELDSDLNRLGAKKDKADIEYREAEMKLSDGEHSWGSSLSVKLNLERYDRVRKSYEFQKGIQILLQAMDHHHDWGNVSKQFSDKTNDARDKVNRLNGQSFDEYFLLCEKADYPREFKRDTHSIQADIYPWIGQQIDFVENNALVSHREMAEQIYEEMKHVFQAAFVRELRYRFDIVKKEMNRLRQILNKQKFHYESYRFKSSYNPRFEEIVKFVEAAHSDDALMDSLFDDKAERQSQHENAIQQIKSLLLDDDADLSHIQDYRKYFNFDLIMRNEKEDWEASWDHRSGIGSGAERQVPFYVSIGAALASTYHGRSSGDANISKGIGLALFDEAFSKMDGKNQRACLDFYRDLGLQVIIAAPAKESGTLKAAMDTIVEVMRDGTTVQIDSYQLKNKVHEAIKERDPSTLTLDEIRAALANRTDDAAE